MASIVDSESAQIPVVVPILFVVQVPVKWCRHVSILLPSTLHVALVVGVGMVVAVASYVPMVGCPTLESEITPITNE